VLQLHNQYRQAGGEDVVVRAERELLENQGNRVDLLEMDNAAIRGFAGQVEAALGAIYSRSAKDRAAARIAEFQPDVVHVHNFFPLLSPSIYYACREAGVPVVQTLHNYRTICPNARLLRDGRICEDCVGRIPWPGVLHACYRDSRVGSATVAAMIAVHRHVGTWKNAVDVFVALTDFCRDKFIEGGMPARKIVIKPNFVPDPGSSGDGGGFALFVGRLSPEKGIATLLSAWERTDSGITLKVAGDGPLAEELARRSARGCIEYLGAQPHEKVLELARDAAFLVFPSTWYEGLPMVIVEAFSVGLPVIASNLGSMVSLVANGRTGLHFRAGDAADLAAKVDWAVAHPEEIARMRREARVEYLAKYTPDRNYDILMQIYGRAIHAKFRSAAP
jgi:glycosyltransferase involved in cell wall biosynthesis